jgi:hypothetical protein
VVDDLQFSLLLLAAHEVSGVVVDQTGSAVAGAVVVLMPDPTMGVLAAAGTGQTDHTGAFRINGVVSGTYRLMAGTGGPPVAQSAPNRSGGVGTIGGVFFGAAAPLQITVGDTDVTGLRIVLPSRFSAR